MIDSRCDEPVRIRARALDVDWGNAWLGPDEAGRLRVHPAEFAEELVAGGLEVEPLEVLDEATVDTLVEPLRAAPAHRSEMISEVRAGERLRRLHREGEWWLVAGEDDYVGWVHGWVLTRVDGKQWGGLHERRLGNYARPLGTLWISDHFAGTPLVLGTPLLRVDAPLTERGDWILVATTMGVEGWLPVEEIEFLADEQAAHAPSAPAVDDGGSIGRAPGGGTAGGRDRPGVEANAGPLPDPARWDADVGRMLQHGRELLGTPYRWGGRSALGLDCSAFVQMLARLSGHRLPRDASQQQRVGAAVSPKAEHWRAGDLLFFGERADHVGLYDGHKGMLHCSARVRRDPLEDIPHLLERLSTVRRPWSEATRRSDSLWGPPAGVPRPGSPR